MNEFKLRWINLINEEEISWLYIIFTLLKKPTLECQTKHKSWYIKILTYLLGYK